MLPLRFIAITALAAWMAPSRPAAAPTLTISVTTEPYSASATLRIIGNGGSVTAGERTFRLQSDTLRVTGSAEFTSSDPIMMATFVGDQPGQFVKATVRENGVETMSGKGELVLVVRTPGGAQLQAMVAPPELRR